MAVPWAASIRVRCFSRLLAFGAVPELLLGAMWSCAARGASVGPLSLGAVGLTARSRAQPAAPAANQEGSGRRRGRMQKRATPTRSIDLLLLVSLQAASHLVLPLAARCACTTRYDLCGARLDSCQHSASSCVALAHPCDQPSAPLLQQQSGSAVEAIDSDAAELREPNERAACAYYRSSRAPWPRRSGTRRESSRSARRSRA